MDLPFRLKSLISQFFLSAAWKGDNLFFQSYGVPHTSENLKLSIENVGDVSPSILHYFCQKLIQRCIFENFQSEFGDTYLKTHLILFTTHFSLKLTLLLETLLILNNIRVIEIVFLAIAFYVFVLYTI